MKEEKGNEYIRGILFVTPPLIKKLEGIAEEGVFGNWDGLGLSFLCTGYHQT